MVDVTTPTTEAHEQARERLLAAAGPILRRALVARYGLEVGADAAADAVAWAVQHWPRLQQMANPLGYLFRVGQSSAKRQHRWRRDTLIVSRARTTPAPDDVIDIDLQRALMALRPEQRTAVLLVHGFGYSYREVAAVLEIAETSVTNHVRRGLARLRTTLQHPGEAP